MVVVAITLVGFGLGGVEPALPVVRDEPALSVARDVLFIVRCSVVVERVKNGLVERVGFDIWVVKPLTEIFIDRQRPVWPRSWFSSYKKKM